jgi:hypothetical protein
MNVRNRKEKSVLVFVSLASCALLTAVLALALALVREVRLRRALEVQDFRP